MARRKTSVWFGHLRQMSKGDSLTGGALYHWIVAVAAEQLARQGIALFKLCFDLLEDFCLLLGLLDKVPHATRYGCDKEGQQCSQEQGPKDNKPDDSAK